MKTSAIERESSDSPSGPARPPAGDDARDRRRSRLLGITAAAALVVAGAAVVGNITGGDDEPQAAATPPLELSLGADDAMASCLPFDVSILSTMSPAFAATATAVEPGAVTLEVDRWYSGGDADTVILRTPNSSPALIGGFEFVAGERYLITAADGNVNFCGFSGVATPELTAAFDAAFPG